MTDITSKYAIYMLRGLPAGVFGEAYVVVAGTELSTDIYRAEHFILTQRPTESLHMDSLDISSNALPEELGIVDVDFSIEEGLRQAKIDLMDLQEERSIELNRPDVALLQFELQTCPSPFVGCRMRGRFLQQLAEIESITKCLTLAGYLRLLNQVSEIGPAS